MSKATILIADNDADFLETRAESLTREGYYVISAATPPEARRLLERGDLDLAILDIRMIDDDDEKDISGLTLAQEFGRQVPKIILTAFPSVEAVREALKPQLDGLPPAVEFVDKKEGPEALARAIRQALGPDTAWLRRVKAAIDAADQELEEDYEQAQQQCEINFWASLGIAVVGAAIIFVGIGLAFWDQVAIGVASAVGGLVTEAVGLLFFKRADAANDRMDRYNRERMVGQRFEMLLQACQGLDSESQCARCREYVIAAAASRWLAQPEQAPGLGEPFGRRGT